MKHVKYSFCDWFDENWEVLLGILIFLLLASGMVCSFILGEQRDRDINQIENEIISQSVPLNDDFLIISSIQDDAECFYVLVHKNTEVLYMCDKNCINFLLMRDKDGDVLTLHDYCANIYDSK